ncbi:glycosyltransferase family 2 protein [Phycisphaerales bacterium AB-hyl4]|uniref:Glycosyltransferase family 2 protein n=1 Tax=Natronomicrosphaera hydrolytica TaxID=3242702 RepID=A0ABV4U672_9BACT
MIRPHTDLHRFDDRSDHRFHTAVHDGTSTPPDPAHHGQPVVVSIVIPLLDEAPNVEPLYLELKAMMDAQSIGYEVIFVDDGSRDATATRLRDIAGGDPRITILELTKRFGQSSAMAAGFARARGSVIVPMDGDCQNDPADIPRLVAKLDERPGWDIVSGWRKTRQDKLLSRRLPSIIANRLIRKLTWTPEVHDFGCSLKAYRRDVLEDVRLYGEMHRFLPAICRWRGARIAELVVNHRPRTAGTSKYGLKRTVKVLLDLLTIKFLGDYLTKPIYFFGKVAVVCMLITILATSLAVMQKFGHLTEHGEPVMLNSNVFLLFAMVMTLMAVLFVMMGVLSELLVRIYHESHGLTPFKVRRITHGAPPTTTPPSDP